MSCEAQNLTGQFDLAERLCPDNFKIKIQLLSRLHGVNEMPSLMNT
jgi:hypothetical protein